MNAVPENVRTFLTLQGCKDSHEAIMLAERFLEAERNAQGKSVPSGRPTEAISEKKENAMKVTALCLPECKARYAKRVCFKCGSSDHLQRSCRAKVALVTTSPGQVKEGFLIAVTVQGVSANALLDSGSDQSMLSRGLWKGIGAQGKAIPDLPSGSVKIRCVHGASSSYPIYKLLVKGCGIGKEILLAIVPHLPQELVLGRDWPQFQRGIQQALQKKESLVAASNPPEVLSKNTRQMMAVPNPLFGKMQKPSRPLPEEKEAKKPVFVLKYCRMSPDAHPPKRASPQAAGFDLYSVEEATVPKHGKALINTALQLELLRAHRPAFRAGRKIHD